MQTLNIKTGLRMLAAQEFEQVHAQCIAAIKADVNNPIAYFLLGVLTSEHGNNAKAIELFTSAEKLDSKQAYYPAYLAKTLSTARNQCLAKTASDRAAALVGDDPFLLDTIAVVYSRAGFHEKAIPLFKRAIALQSDQANMHYNLAASAQFVGDFTLAKDSYTAALKLDTNFYRAWASLVYLDKQTKADNSLPALIKLFDKNKDNSDAQLQLGHAIAKTYEDLDNHEQSYEWLIHAKQSKRSKLRYDRIAGADTFEAAKRTIAKPSSVNQSSVKSISLSTNPATPIFIVGLPRTGTTLVDRILSSHSQVTSVGELNLFAELIKSASGSDSNLVLDAQTLSNLSDIDLGNIGKQYLDRSSELARGHLFQVDKMPLNFFYSGLIQRALPNAKIIALRRGAMDSCLSNFRQLFSTQHSFYNYTFDLQDVAWFYQRFDDLMTHWRGNLPAQQFIEIQYENIVFDLQSQTRLLLDYCGLDWQEACMNFHENDAPVSTASSVQVRQPLYSGSIGRWKKYGEKVSSLREALGDLAAKNSI